MGAAELEVSDLEAWTKKGFLILDFGHLCLITLSLSCSSSPSKSPLFSRKESEMGLRGGAGRRLKGGSKNADDMDLGSGQNPALLDL